MAKTFKQPPKQNLFGVPVLIEDITSYSKYFEIAEFNRIFHAGKNGFLIRGSSFLLQGSQISIELLDRFNNPIFATPVDGFSEASSRLVSVEISQKIQRGPGRLILLGTAGTYADGRPIPERWQNRTNVRWVVPIQIEPRNQNISTIRLDTRTSTPIAVVAERNFTTTRVDTTTAVDMGVGQPTTNRVGATATGFRTASLQYDWLGHKSDGYAITMLSSSGAPLPFFDESNAGGYFTGSVSKRVIESSSLGTITVVSNPTTASVSMSLDKILDESTAITNTPIKFGDGSDYLNPTLTSGSFERVIKGSGTSKRTIEQYTSSVIFEYVSESVATTLNTSSVINFRIPFVQTHTGEIAKVKISAKEANPNITSFQPFTEFIPAEKNIITSSTVTGDLAAGTFPIQSTVSNNWFASAWVDSGGDFNQSEYDSDGTSLTYEKAVVTSSDNILEGAFVDNIASSIEYFLGTKKSVQLYNNIEYTLKYTAVYTPTYVSSSAGSPVATYSTTDTGSLKTFLTRIGSGSTARDNSAIANNDSEPLGVGSISKYGMLVDSINTKTNDKSLYEREVNFKVPRNGSAYLRFKSEDGFWNFGNIEITPSVEKGFHPDEIIFDAENNTLANTTNVFKIQFLNFRDEPIDFEIITDPIFISGSRLAKIMKLSTDRPTFTFTSDGSPDPAGQTATIDLSTTNILNNPVWTAVNDDGTAVNNLSTLYTTTDATFVLKVAAFGFQSQSAAAIADYDPVSITDANFTSSVLVTATADDVSDQVRITRVKDASTGAAGVAGEDAKTVSLSADSLVFVKSNAGIYSPEYITLTANKQNTTATTNWTKDQTINLYNASSGGSTTTTGDTVYLRRADWITLGEQTLTITATADSIADSATIVDLDEGSGNITAILSNEAHVMPASAVGAVSSYTGTGTTIRVYEGATELTFVTGTPAAGQWAVAVGNTADITEGGVTDEGTYATIADHEAAANGTDVYVITYTISGHARNDTAFTTFTKTQTLSKSKIGTDGSSGTDSKVVHLTSPDYTLVYNSAGGSPSPAGDSNAKLSLTATAQNFVDPYFKFTGDGVVDDGSYTNGNSGSTQDGHDFSVPAAHFTGTKSIRVGVAEASDAATELAFDSITIVGVKPGADGFTVVVTNESHTLPAASDGTVSSYSGTGTDIEVYEGGTQLSYDATASYAAPSWRLAATPTNIVLGQTGGADHGPIDDGAVTDGIFRIGDYSGMASGTSTVARVDFVITVTTSAGETVSFTKVQSLTKSSAGATGGTGGTGPAGDEGPGVVYRGAWEAGVLYYKTDIRRDAVKHGGNYYLADVTHTSTNNTTTGTGYPPTDSPWDAFGSQFDSVATDILLTQDASVGRGLVLGTDTVIDEDGAAINHTSNTTTVTLADANTAIEVGMQVAATSEAGIPANTFITAVAGDNESFTMSNAATATDTGIDLDITPVGFMRSYGATSPTTGTGFWLDTRGNFRAGNPSVGQLSVDSAGVVTLAGWTATATALTAGSTTTTVALTPGTGIHMGHASFASAPFSVTNAGVLKSTSGTVGGWTLGASTLTGTNIELDNSGNITVGGATTHDIVKLSRSDGTYRIWVGNTAGASAPFSVTKAGVLAATGATITGVITATAGAIAGWTVDSTDGIYKLDSGTPASSPNTGIVISTTRGSNSKASIKVYDGTTLNAELGNFASGKYGIYAIEGLIGGFYLTETDLHGPNAALGNTLTRMVIGDMASTKPKLALGNAGTAGSPVTADNITHGDYFTQATCVINTNTTTVTHPENATIKTLVDAGTVKVNGPGITAGTTISSAAANNLSFVLSAAPTVTDSSVTLSFSSTPVGTGLYADGDGNFRVGGTTNYIGFDASTGTITLNGTLKGTGAAALDGFGIDNLTTVGLDQQNYFRDGNTTSRTIEISGGKSLSVGTAGTHIWLDASLAAAAESSNQVGLSGQGSADMSGHVMYIKGGDVKFEGGSLTVLGSISCTTLTQTGGAVSSAVRYTATANPGSVAATADTEHFKIIVGGVTVGSMWSDINNTTPTLGSLKLGVFGGPSSESEIDEAGTVTVLQLLSTAQDTNNTAGFIIQQQDDGVGRVTKGQWQGSIIQATYGGSGLVGATNGMIAIADGSGAPTTLDVGSSAGITILGTIATGVWQGTDIAHSYIADSIPFSKMANLTNSRLLVSDGSGDVSVSSITSAKAEFLSDVTSNIEAQINTKAPTASPGFTTQISLDGETMSAALWKAYKDATGLTTGELNILDGLTASTADLNLLDDANSNGLVKADLTKLASLSVSSAELNLLDALSRGSIIYGSSGGTAVLGKGDSGEVLTSGGSDISWAAPAASTTVSVTGTQGGATYFPVFVDTASSGTRTLYTDTGANLGYNPSTDTLTISKLSGFTAQGSINFNNQDMTNVDIDSGVITGITDLAVADGGTGASNSNSWLNSRVTINADGTLNYDATSATAPNHDSLAGFVSNEHIDHSGVTITAGAGMTGGGTIAATRTLNVIGSTGITVNADNITTNDGQIVHDNLSGAVANEHIDHTAVTLTAGDGLTGGGTIASNRTFTVVGGNGITANSGDVAVTAAQTTITGVHNAALQIGRDSHNEFDFSTDNVIKVSVNAVDDEFRFAAGGDFHADGDVIAKSTTTSSDIKLKTNIVPTKYGLTDVLKLRGVDFNWKQGAGARDVGLIAQEVQEVIPELVKEVDTLHTENETHLTLDYMKLVPVLIESIKELSAEIETLKKKSGE